MNISASHNTGWAARGGSDRLSRFGRMLARYWLLIASVWLSAVAVALILAFVLSSYWRVEIVVMPVTRSANVNIGSALAGGLGGLGGLSSLLGRPSGNQDEAMAVLRSRELFDIYATQKRLLPILYADRWDAQAGRWNVAPSRVPTLRQAYKLFNTKIRDIDLDRRSGIVTLAITWKDRALAAQWARDLIALTNAQLRSRAIADAQSNMAYLDGELRRTGAVSAQNALTTALSAAYDRALQDYMFAKGQPDFAFRVIDPPTIPDDRERVWPQRTLFAILGFLLGAILAVAAAFTVDLLRARHDPQAP